jgi:hypothetical protein
MNETPVVYVGYLTLEEWLRVVDRKRAVFANLVIEPGAVTQYGMRSDHMIIRAAQAEGALVHYCRITVGTLRYHGDSAFDADRRPAAGGGPGRW